MGDELANIWFQWRGAIKCQATQKVWRHDELHGATDRIIFELKKRGVCEGETVVLMLANTAAFPVVLVALLVMGCTPLLLHGGSTVYELQHIMEELSCRHCVHDFVETVSRVSETEQRIHWTHAAMMECVTLRIGTMSGQSHIPLFQKGEGILHLTSGTYGSAKYCIRPQSSAYHEAHDYVTSISLYDKVKVTVLTPMSHAYAFGFGLVSSLLTNSTLSLYPYFNARKVLRNLSQDAGNIVMLVPPMMEALKKMAEADCSLKAMPEHVFSAGTRADQSVVAAFEEHFNTSVWQIYGTTETGGIATNFSHAEAKASIGRPLNNVQVDIDDQSQYSALHPGTGEIVVTSPSMMQGYAGCEPVSDCQWPTGDLGYRNDDGNLVLVGRKRAIINVGGCKVDPAEVETVLLRLAGISDAVVYPGINDKNEEIVQAVIVAAERNTTASAVHNFCHRHLSSVKVPVAIHLLDEIPRSPSGKVLSKQLPKFPADDHYAFPANDGESGDV